MRKLNGEKTARWIRDDGPNPPYCSNCLTYALEDPAGDFAMTNYCPECGALMCGMVNIGVTEFVWTPRPRPQESISVQLPHPLEYVKVVSRYV